MEHINAIVKNQQYTTAEYQKNTKGLLMHLKVIRRTLWDGIRKSEHLEWTSVTCGLFILATAQGTYTVS